jgi:hypothetical protein
MDLELPVLPNTKPTCDGCVAHCCRYISIEIDRPDTKWQYDQIRWMLLHGGISVGVNAENEWYVEIQARCEELDERNMCRSYLTRPQLCEDYSNEECPVWSPGSAYEFEFKTEAEFTAWLDQRGVDWRYKAHEKRELPGRLQLAGKRKLAEG